MDIVKGTRKGGSVQPFDIINDSILAKSRDFKQYVQHFV